MDSVRLIVELLVMTCAITLMAQKLRLPYSILLVIGGLVLGFVPGLPIIKLQPDLIFFLFLPPLLYIAALRASWRDFRNNIRAISFLAIGLVLATTVAVAWIAHHVIPHMNWPEAFVLGAIVSSPEAMAAMEITQCVKVPRRITTILEGESLTNDAMALVAYQFAIIATVMGIFSFWNALGHFIWALIGGIAVGLAVGWGVAWIRKRIPINPSVETTISLLTPFAAYIPADRLGVSGVLATVVTGLYLGRKGSTIVSAPTRLQTGMVWDTVIFLLNGLLFILIGFQLHPILSSLSSELIPELFASILWIVGTVILLRLAWVFPAAYLPVFFLRKTHHRENYPSWRSVLIIGWTGMRGAVSLAAALAIPYTLHNGEAFPHRKLIILLTFSVIFITMVVQGLSLPKLIRRIKLKEDTSLKDEELLARAAAAQSSIAHLNTLTQQSGDGRMAQPIERLKAGYIQRIAHLHANSEKDNPNLSYHHEYSDTYRNIKRDLLGIERRTIIHLRNEGVIGDEILQRVQHDLDLEDARL